MSQVTRFFDALWQDYTQLTPQAAAIHTLFTGQGESVVNDHVAFRTLANSPIALSRLEPLLLALGFAIDDDYRFDSKHLLAKSYRHSDPLVAKIFLSELQVEQLSAPAQQILTQIIEEIPNDAANDESIFYRGLLWSLPTLEQYRTLAQESEYAAWLATMGLRANHFTVSVNHLEKLTSLEKVLDLLKGQGFQLNTVGGEIKGVPDDLLEQASTLADRTELSFRDGEKQQVPTCFYEFARRYPGHNGEVFQGFIANNADKIFESTNLN